MIAFTRYNQEATTALREHADVLGYDATCFTVSDIDDLETVSDTFQGGDAAYTGFVVEAADQQVFHRERGQARSQVDVVLAGDNGIGLNREAVEQDTVDILLISLPGKTDTFDHVLAKRAAATGTCILFDLTPLLETGAKQRTYLLQTLRTYLRYATHYGTPHFYTVYTADPYLMRSHRSLESIGRTLTRLPPHSQYREWSEALQKTVMHRRDPGTVRPGVHVEETGGDTSE